MDHSRPHFFLFPMPAPGHTLPYVDLAKLFATRGARVTLILVENDSIPSAVASVSRLKQLGHPISVELLTLPIEFEGLNAVENAKSMAEAQKLIMEALPRLEPAFRGLVTDLLPDSVVTDMFLTWTAGVAEEFGIPRLLFAGNSNFAMCAEHAISKFNPQATATSDSESFVLPGLPDEVRLTNGQIPSFQSPQIQEWWKRVEAARAKSYGLVMNSYYELERNYIKHMELIFPAKPIWQVGPLFLIDQNVKEAVMRGKTSKDAQEYINWLDSQQLNTVLYVCFGSFSTFPPPQMAEIAAALEELSVPFVWVVKSIEVLPEGFEERVGDRGLVIRGWAPQLVLLGHDAVGGFVTHCGWNSVLEGLTAGLPMVTWPVFAEQFYNEKLVTEVLRVGVKVGAEKWGMPDMEKEVVPSERVKRAVGRVMGDGEEADGMRERARTAAKAARAAVAEGGSSYLELDRLIGEVKALRVKSDTKSDLDKE